jgi:hypothetical protein
MAIISSDIIENKNILDPYNIKKYFKAKNNNDLAEQLVYLYENKKEVKTLMYNSQEIKEFDKAYAAEIINKHI